MQFISVNPPDFLSDAVTKMHINVDNILMVVSATAKDHSEKTILYMAGNIQMPVNESVEDVLDKIAAQGPPPPEVPAAFKKMFEADDD